MKSRILRAIYFKYRSYFYDFFVDEFMGDIPKDVKEPAMTFLSQGKERLEKWSLFQARVLQTRLVRDPALINTYSGMLLMLKLLLVHTEAPSRKPSLPAAQKAKTDHAKQALDVTEEFRKLLSTAPASTEVE